MVPRSPAGGESIFAESRSGVNRGLARARDLVIDRVQGEDLAREKMHLPHPGARADAGP